MAPDVPGMMFFGWWKTDPPSLRNFAGFAECWPVGAAAFRYYEFHSDQAHLIEVDIRILRHPEAWIETITKSLEFFVNAGALIAWTGGYEGFVQYQQGSRFEGCYAAYTRGTGLVCLGGLDEPLRYISDEPALARGLNSAVAGALRD